MKSFTILGIALCASAALSYGETYSGKLMDAACYRDQKAATQESGHKTYKSITKTCAPTPQSTTFAVRITGSAHHGHEGLTLKLDDKGNTMAASALQSGALKLDRDNDMHVVIRGKSEGDAFYTDSVSAQRGHGTKAEE